MLLAASVVTWFAATYLGLVLTGSPLVLLGIAGVPCGAALVTYLLQRPAEAFYVALCLYLVPFGIRPAEADLAFTIGMNGAIALALASWLLHAMRQPRPVAWSPVLSLVAIYLLWTCISLLWAPDLVEARKTIVGYCLGLVLLFLAINTVRSVRSLDAVMRVIRINCYLIVAAGIVTYVMIHAPSGTRLKILDMNENALGYYFTLMTASFIWPVMRASGSMRLLRLAASFVYLFVALVLILLSGSRGSAISLIVMILAFALTKPLRPWAMLVPVGAAVALVAAPFLLDALSSRLDEKGGNALGGRNILWAASVALIKDHPIAGMGVGNGRYELHNYVAPLTSSYDHRPDLPSHNPFLEVGVDTGLIGIVVYLGIWVAALLTLWSSRRELRSRGDAFANYVPLMLCVTLGYVSSYIKAGGLENHPTFFLLMALLAIPAHLAPCRVPILRVDRSIDPHEAPRNIPSRLVRMGGGIRRRAG